MKSKICLCVTEQNLSKGLAKLEIINSITDVSSVEFRADFFENNLSEEAIAKFRKKCKKKAIFTLRKKREGGLCTLSDDQRSEFFKIALKSGFDLVDIELSSKKIMENLKCSKKTVLSYHDFEKTSKRSLFNVLNKMILLSPKVIKIIPTAKSKKDLEAIKELFLAGRKKCKNLVVHGMGNIGKSTRIDGFLNGNYFTYVSFGKKAAPGQVSLEELRKVF